MPSITEKFVRGLDGAKPGYIWDDRLKGFAVRVLADGESGYYVKYRVHGAVRWHRIGPTSLFNSQQARSRAEEILAQAKLGRDIVAEIKVLKNQPTVAELAEKHQDLHRPPTISEKSFYNYSNYWRNHIVPKLGKKKVADLTETDIQKWYSEIKGPGARWGAFGCLKKALTDCEKWGWRPKHSNPCHEVKRKQTPHRDRILNRDELKRIMVAMIELKQEVERPDYIDCFMLLLLTGLRLREILCAEWSQVDWDFKALKLRKTKSGKQRVAHLGDKGIEILRGLQKAQVIRSQWIFPARDGDGPVLYPHWCWYKVLDRAGIEEFRIHDLRHTAASYAHAFAGLSGRDVQQMLGHTNLQTTSRYLNLTDELRAEGADRRNNALLALAKV